MPTQTGKSVLAKLGNQGRAAFDATAGSTKDFGGASHCPPGVNNGICQVTKCYFGEVAQGKQHAGQPYFYVEARVQQPTHLKGASIIGTMVSSIEMLCDTPEKTGERARKTAQDHWEWVRWWFKQAGITDVSFENLEAVAAHIQNSKPCLKFRSWAMPRQVIAQSPDGKWRLFDEDENGTRKPSNNKSAWATEALAKAANKYAGRDPLTNYQWQGVCDYQANGAVGVADHSAEETATPDSEPPDEDAGAGDAEPMGEAEITQGAATTTGGYEELEALAATADSIKDPRKATPDQANATKALNQAALEAGLTQEEIDDATSWAYIVKQIKERSEAAATGGEEPAGDTEPAPDAEPAAEEESQPPAKGEVWRTKLKNPKSGRMAFAEVEVIGVSVKNMTVTVKHNGKTVEENGKPKPIPWSELSPLPE